MGRQLNPLTQRLYTDGRARGTAAAAQRPHAFTSNAAEFSQDQRRELFGVLERELETGEADAVATGFFEALLNDYDRGFDLRPVWPDLGPKSRAYCLAWNEFSGMTSPDWMT